MKILISIIISIIPINFIKIFLYNKLLNYKITYNCKIGFLVVIISNDCLINTTSIESFTILSVNKLNINYCKIKKFNIIKNFYHLSMNNNCYLGFFNKIVGERKISNKSSLIIGRNVRIENKNYLDLTESIYIGENIKISSFCQFWTHGYSAKRKLKIGQINLKKNSIINTGCLISHGITVGENSILEAGSVVVKDLKGEKYYFHKSQFWKSKILSILQKTGADKSRRAVQ